MWSRDRKRVCDVSGVYRMEIRVMRTVMIVSVFFFFKPKTAYRIPSCLRGSEMCIRDRIPKYPNRENAPRNGYEKRPEVVGSPGMNFVLVWRKKLQ